MSKMNRGRRRDRDEDDGNNLIEKVIYINRVAKVVKGGRRFSFSAIVVVGNGEGECGFGFGKANEVPESIRKATERARKNVKKYPLVGTTTAHYIQGQFGASNVVLRPASPGTGVIAGAAVRAIMECLGVSDILTKSLGSNNPHNVVRAVFDGLGNLESVEQYANRVGRSVEEILPNYTVRGLAAVS